MSPENDGFPGEMRRTWRVLDFDLVTNVFEADEPKQADREEELAMNE